MNKIGNIIAFIINKIAVILLIVVVLLLAQATAIAQIVTNREEVKTILAESNVYENLPNNIIYILKLNNEENEAGTNENSESTDKTVYQVLEENGFIKADDFNKVLLKVVSPEFLKSQTENLINGVYNYLEGKKPNIVFIFSLKDRAEIAKSELSQLIKDRLAALPACNYQQLIAQADQEINILEASCLPPGVSLQSKIDDFTNELTTQDGVFAQELTQEDFNISDANASLAKYVFTSLKTLIWMFWLLVAAFTVVIILTAKTLYRGLKIAGITLVVLGTLLLLGYILSVNSYDFVNNVVLNNNNMTQREADAMVAIAKPLSDSFVGHLVQKVTIISVILFVVGAVLTVLGFIAKRHNFEHLGLFHKKHKPDQQVPTNEKEPQFNVEVTNNDELSSNEPETVDKTIKTNTLEDKTIKDINI